MLKVKYVLRYIVKNYPYPSELSKTRITKLVYLADWFAALEREKQLTKINWYFDHYGPYVSDVYEVASKDRMLKIVISKNSYGNNKEIISLNESDIFPLYNLKSFEKAILDKVIEETKNFNWTEFINYIYNTYPIKKANKYNYLNLVELAKEMKQSMI